MRTRGKVHTLTSAIALLFLGGGSAFPHLAGQGSVADRAYELFACAIQNHSTAPNLVLITVTDGNSGNISQIATGANLLSGAIHREHDIPYSKDGERRADEIALSAHDRHFTFANRGALRNIEPRYSREVLAEVRERLASLTEPDIRARLPGRATNYEQTLHSIYMSRSPWKSRAAYRDALGHVLLERGILCGIADVSGQLYVDSDPCPRDQGHGA